MHLLVLSCLSILVVCIYLILCGSGRTLTLGLRIRLHLPEAPFLHSLGYKQHADMMITLHLDSPTSMTRYVPSRFLVLFPHRCNTCTVLHAILEEKSHSLQHFVFRLHCVLLTCHFSFLYPDLDMQKYWFVFQKEHRGQYLHNILSCCVPLPLGKNGTWIGK